MAEYIDRNGLIEALNKFAPEHYNALINQLITKYPTADVEEVKHGEWSHLGADEWCCTNCGEVVTTEGSWDIPLKKYCNECGAKMDGGKANDL